MNSNTQQFIKELKTDSNVLGILLFGSWARGNNRPDSDVDLLVIVQDGFKRTVEYREGQAFEITYTTEQRATEYWQSNPNGAAELWSIARILFDRDGTMARLQKVGNEIKERGKTALTIDQYEHYKFDVHDQLKAIEELAKSDEISAKMLLSIKVHQLTELFFDIRELWTPPPKQRLTLIKNLDHTLYDLIAEYYGENSLAKQMRIVKSMGAIVFDK